MFSAHVQLTVNSHCIIKENSPSSVWRLSFFLSVASVTGARDFLVWFPQNTLSKVGKEILPGKMQWRTWPILNNPYYRMSPSLLSSM